MADKRNQNEERELDEDRGDAIIGVAFLWSLLVIGVAATAIGGVIYWSWTPRTKPVTGHTALIGPEFRDVSGVVLPTATFVDVTEKTGIDFVHENGALGQKLLPETMGGGCAIFDYDNDGDQDILLVNSSSWDWDRDGATPPPPAGLYRNEGNWNFTDVTSQAGLTASMYGMGCAVGDFDNDGWVDLYLTAVGSNRLYRNQDGFFADQTAGSGTAGAGGWSTSAAWFDYDNDGRLDLAVCNYVQWKKELDLSQDFQLVGVGRAYGPPQQFDGAFMSLFHNEGSGRFKDVSISAGMQVRNAATNVPVGKALGVSPVDLDRDGWLDLIVANDTVGNFLFHNRGDGSFEEMGGDAGIANDLAGEPTGAMGIDAAFFRNNEHLGVVIGNFANEPTSLYVDELGEMLFNDVATSSGLGPATRKELTFGVCFFDYDLDGRLDLLAANGHLEEEINKVQRSQHYQQPAQLFWNTGLRRGGPEFVMASAKNIGSDLAKPMVGRGAAYGDLDGDGDLDILLCSLGGPPRLLENRLEARNWLRLKLVGQECNRDAIGALVVARVGKQTLRRRVMPTRGYLSQSERIVTLGLGEATSIDELTVVWPGGSHQGVPLGELNRMHVVEQQ
jgi:hypothetical protein